MQKKKKNNELETLKCMLVMSEKKGQFSKAFIGNLKIEEDPFFLTMSQKVYVVGFFIL